MKKKWWWLSFCDPEKPEGSQFLGVSVVQGYNIIDVVDTSWKLGCNPGGEVLCIETDISDIPEDKRNMFLTLASLKELNIKLLQPFLMSEEEILVVLEEQKVVELDMGE